MSATRPKIAHVLHSMVVAGAETLVHEMSRRLDDEFDHCAFLLDAVGPLGEELARNGAQVECLGRKPGVDVPLIRRLARGLRRSGVQLVHAHQYTPWFYATLSAALGWRRPRLLFTEHGRHYPDVARPKRLAFNQGLLPFTDGLVAVSGFVRDCLAANEALPRRRIRVVYNGVDPARFEQGAPRAEVRASQGLEPGDLVVGIAARFAPVKDHATLLRAFTRVVREIPEAKLALAGDGELRGALEAQAKELGIASACRFLGVRRDIPDLLHSWDVFCLSSLSEGTSVTLLEAMSSALPVVATRVGGNPEIVQEGETGLLAPRGDDAALAAALTGVLRDPDRARCMGEAGRARVRAHFTIERMTTDYRGLYRELLSGART